MYNYLVTAEKGAWEQGFYKFHKSRFLEYTNKDIVTKYDFLSAKQLASLKAYPCLFAYEGEDDPMRIGYLTSIASSGPFLVIEFEFSDSIPEIPFDAINPYAPLLDIRGWEINRTHWAVKDVDLLRVLKKYEVIEENVSPITPQEEEPAKDRSSNPRVSTVKGFISKIFELGFPRQKEVFYRGHSKKTYRIEPSLFRTDNSGNYIYLDNEHILYRELLVSNSSDFQGDVYTLDSLVRMQHYSLPTRLLDITSNPLIALYFSCRSAPEQDGEVVIFSMDRKQVKYFDSDVASCIANLARLPKSEKDLIDFNLPDFNNQKPVGRLLHFIREEKPFFESRVDPEDLRRIVCVKGKKSNDRIASQSGAFLLFGQDAVFDESGTDDIDIARVSVSNKKDILEELDLLNINESTVFPYIENSARYVARKFSFEKGA
ncbi:FRG domain-containing protein [Guyparkeria halophila]|uniref:FRG domain-containing protein n=1 Tax=Guyparkeria halophila TaxID=47960 RepID=A0ABZ0YUL2_9GAMM|nr:FRG domain-containing protein [Guyparkeria halophila]WQH15696.1 FRG domain-containing protein [Guyparkeria halophila]